MRTIIGKCKKCGHQVCKVTHEKGVVNKLFNGAVCHANIGRKWAVVCRVKKCGCLKPELKDKGSVNLYSTHGIRSSVNVLTKVETTYETKTYKIIRRFYNDESFGKLSWICKGCSKEFKQFVRFNNHQFKGCE